MKAAPKVSPVWTFFEFFKNYFHQFYFSTLAQSFHCWFVEWWTNFDNVIWPICAIYYASDKKGSTERICNYFPNKFQLNPRLSFLLRAHRIALQILHHRAIVWHFKMHLRAPFSRSLCRIVTEAFFLSNTWHRIAQQLSWSTLLQYSLVSWRCLRHFVLN